MKVVYKYRCETLPHSFLEMPRDAQILSTNIQDGSFHVWALVEENAPKCNRLIMVFGTGWDVSSDAAGKKKCDYIGTIFEDGLVWHVFDGGEYGADEESG